MCYLSSSVYLRTSPEVCLERIHKRARKEEKPVTLVCGGRGICVYMHAYIRIYKHIWYLYASKFIIHAVIDLFSRSWIMLYSELHTFANIICTTYVNKFLVV